MAASSQFIHRLGQEVDTEFATTGRYLPRADQRDRLVALEQIEQAAQRVAAGAVELRIVLHDAQRLVARLRDQLRMNLAARDAVAGQAALPDPEHVAFAAQPQILFCDPEAVAGLPDDVEPRLGQRAERFAVEQQAGRGLRAAADAAAQLVQLRETEALGVF